MLKELEILKFFQFSTNLNYLEVDTNTKTVDSIQSIIEKVETELRRETNRVEVLNEKEIP